MVSGPHYELPGLSEGQAQDAVRHPEFELPDTSFLLYGKFEQVGFDLWVINPAGEVVVVHDYFSFDPPPNLVVTNGSGLSPEMVRSLMPGSFGDDVMFAGPANSASAQIEIGKVTLAFGDVRVRRADGTEEKLGKGDILYKGDVIITGGRAFFKAEMLDGTRFHLGKNAEAALEDFDYNESAGVGNFSATVRVGAFHYKSGKIGEINKGNQHTTIKTPSAVIGVRGSELDGNVDSSGQTVVVHKSGYLVISDINGSNQVVLDTPGNASIIQTNGSPSFSQQASAQQMQTLNQNLQPPPGADDADDATQDDDQSESEDGDTGEDAPGDPEQSESEESPAAEAGNGESGEGEDSEIGDEDIGDEESGDDDSSDEDVGDESDAAQAEESEGEEDSLAEGEDQAEEGQQAGEDAQQTDGQDADSEGQDTAGDQTQDASEPVTADGSQVADDGQSGTATGDNTQTQESGDSSQQTGDGTDTNQVPRDNTFTSDQGADSGDIDGTTDLGTNDTSGSNQTSGNQSTLQTSTSINQDTNQTTQDQNQSDSNNEPTTEPLIVDNAPLAVDDTLRITTADAISLDSRLLANDSDPDAGQTPVVAAVEGVQGRISLSADGNNFILTPSAELLAGLGQGETAVETFTYTIFSGNLQDAATLTLTYVGANDPPVLTETSEPPEVEATTGETTFELSDFFSDADLGSELTLVELDDSQTLGSVREGSIIYDPNGAFDYLDDGETAVDTFGLTVQDENGAQGSGNPEIVITGQNDAPVAVNDTVTVAEDGGAISIAVLANDSDVDTTDQPKLVNGITITSGPTGGTASVNASGQIDYQPGANFFGVDTLTYRLSDGDAADLATVTINVTAVPDNPVANNDVYTLNEDGSISRTVSNGLQVNDNDADGNTLTYSQVTGPANGGLTLGMGGGFTYTPNANFSGQDSFTYRVNDGTGRTDTATVTLNVTPVNDAPVVQNDATSTSEDFPISGIDVLVNDSDVEGNPLTVTSAVAGNGAVTIQSGSLLDYLPDADFNGTDVITYTVSDGAGGSATGQVSITVAPINDAPVAVDDTSYSTLENNALNIPAGTGVLANDMDVDGDMLSASLNTDVSNGTLMLNPDGSFDYLPDTDFAGTDQFTYIVSDGSAGQTATVTITVINVNNPPVAIDDTGNTNEDSSFTTVNVLLNDTDADATDVLSVSGLNTGGTQGNVTQNGDGTFLYDPNGQFEALPLGQSTTDIFSYTLSDGLGGSDIGTVSIFITGVNDAPVAVADSRSTSEDVTLTGTTSVVSNDQDVDVGDVLNVSLVSDVNNGFLTLNPDGTFVYIPATDFSGTDSFVYSVSDGNGGVDTTTATITVNPVNDAPLAVTDTATVTENTSQNINVLANDTDAELDMLTVVGTTGSPVGIVTANGGDVTYDPNGQFEFLAVGETAIDTFSYQVSDGQGGTHTAMVTVTINGANDNPLATSDSAVFSEDGPAASINLLANDVDVDSSDVLSVGGVNVTGTLGTVTNNGTDVTYDPNGQFEFLAVGETAVDTFTYQVTDGQGGTHTATVSVTINGANDNPLATSDSAVFGEDGPAASISLLANDVDVDSSDVLSVGGVNVTGTLGTVTNNGTDVTYDPNGQFEFLAVGETAVDTFTYQVTDGQGGTHTATVSVTINGANDNPLAASDSAVFGEDGPAASINLLANDVDVDSSDVLSVGSVNVTGTLGTVTNNGTDVTYDPNGQFEFLAVGETAVDTFTYQVTDGQGGTHTATVSVTINGANDNPLAASDSAVFGEDGPAASINLLANDVDVDSSDVLSVGGVNVTGTLGTVTNNGTDVTYDPNGQFESLAVGETAIDTFTYQVTDGQGGTHTATVSVTINGANDNPLAVVDTDTTSEDLPITTLNVLTNDTDADTNDMLSVTGLSTTGTIGLVVNNGDGTFDYDPNGQFEYLGDAGTAVDSFSYVVSDGNGGTSIGTVTINITGVNDAPVAVDDTTTIGENSTLVAFDVLANDVDPEGVPLSVTTSTATNGVVIVNGDNSIDYTPDTNFVGTDMISYTVSDGTLTTIGTVTVFIDPSPVPLSNLLFEQTIVDEFFGRQVDFTDSETVTFTTTGLPTGLISFPAAGTATGLQTVDITGTTTAIGDFLVTISATDSLSTGKEVFVISVEQNPYFFSGGIYNLQENVNDTVIGQSSGTISLNGAAEEGDRVLGSIGVAVDLDGAGNTLTVVGVDSVFDSLNTGVDIITFEGFGGTDFTGLNTGDLVINQGDLQVFGSHAADFGNFGNLEVRDTTASFANFVNNVGAAFAVQGDSFTTTATIQNGFVNDGLTIVKSSSGFVATLSETGGLFTNNGQLIFDGTGTNRFSASGAGGFVQGTTSTLNVLQDVTFFGPLSVFNLNDGFVYIDDFKTLTIENATLVVGSNTFLDGHDATIAFTHTGVNNATLEIDSFYQIYHDGPQFDFSAGDVIVNPATSTATLTLSTTVQLTLSADDVNTDISNLGTLRIDPGESNITGQYRDLFSPRSELIVEANGTQSATVNFTLDFTNNGTITLDTTAVNSASINIGGGAGNLTNSSTGVIHIRDTSGGGINQLISGSLSNSGDLLIDDGAGLDLSGSAGVYTNFGRIEIGGHGGGTSTMTISGASMFTNETGGIIQGHGTLSADTQLVQSGVLRPENGGGPGLLTIGASVLDSTSAVVELDVFSTMTTDQIDIQGAYTIDASSLLKLNFHGSHDFYGEMLSETFAIILYDSNISASNFNVANVTHNLAAGYNVTTAANGTTTGSITVTVTGEFEKTFNGGPEFWKSANATPGTTFTSTMDVHLGSDILVQHGVSALDTSTAVTTIRSISVEDGNTGTTSSTTLVITAHDVAPSTTDVFTLELVEQSATAFGTVLVLESIGQDYGALQVDDLLTVNGGFLWTGGHLRDTNTSDTATSTVVLSNSGDLLLSTQLNPVLDLRLENHGQIAFQDDTTVDTGSLSTNFGGEIINFGFLDTIRNPTIAVDVVNEEMASMNIGAGATTTNITTFTSNLTNHGYLSILNQSGVSGKFVSLDVSAGTFINDGFLVFDDVTTSTTETLELVVGTGFDNQDGEILVLQDASIQSVGVYTINATGGGIFVDSSKTLTLAGDANLQIDDGSFLSGAGTILFDGGTLELFGDSHIDLNVDMINGVADTITSVSLQELGIGSAGAVFLEGGDQIGANIDVFVDGLLEVTTVSATNVAIGGNVEVGQSGLFNIQGGASGTTTVSGDIVNHGQIHIDSTILGNSRLQVGDGSGTLKIEDSGTLLISGNTISEYMLVGRLENNGTFDIGFQIRLDGTNTATTTHVSNGLLSIDDGIKLILGNDDVLITSKDNVIQGLGAIEVGSSNAHIINSGIIAPGTTSTSIGTLTINGDLELDQTSIVEIEVNGNTAGTNVDQIAAQGFASDAGVITLGGRLKLNVLGGYTSGTITGVLTAAGGFLESFTGVEGLVLDASTVLDFTVNTTSIDLQSVAETHAGTGFVSFTNAGSTEIVVTGAGVDEVSGVNLGDIAYVEGADDTVIVDAMTFKRVDGGDGKDTLELNLGGAANVDFTTVAGHQIDNFEVIDIEDSLDQILTFDAQAIRNIVDNDFDTSLIINGDHNDKVVLLGDFFPSGQESIDLDGVADVFDVLAEGPTSLIVNRQVEVEVQHNDGSVTRLGTDIDDNLVGTGNDDRLRGGDGDDLLDGQGGDDELLGGRGNDLINFDASDTHLVDGGTGFDTLISPNALIDLTAVDTNFRNFEAIDLSGTPTGLALSISDVLDLVGDNALDLFGDAASGSPNDNPKLVVNGDEGDVVTLDGQDLTNITGGSLAGGNTSNFGVTYELFGDGEQYYLIQDGGSSIDLYVHSNLVDPDPFG